MYHIQRPLIARDTCGIAALTTGWRNALTEALDLNGSGFLLAMGTAGLRTDDNSGFYTFADTLPENEQVYWYQGAAGARRSTAYLAMLRGLLPVREYGLHGILGVHYNDWIQVRNEDRSGQSQRVLFRDWALACLDQRLSSAAIRIFNASLCDPVNRAIDAFHSVRNRVPYVGPNGRIQQLPLYSGGVEAAQAALDGSARKAVRFDSRSLPSLDAGQSRSKKAPRFFASNLSGRAALEEKIFSGNIFLTGQIDHAGMMVTQAEKWCDLYEIDRVWQGGLDKQIWDDAADDCTWDRFFGARGGLARRMEHLLVVGGFDLTLTCSAQFTDEDVAMFRACSVSGVWPLQAIEGRPVHKMTIVHNPDKSVSVRMSLAKDKMQIWGGSLVDAPD